MKKKIKVIENNSPEIEIKKAIPKEAFENQSIKLYSDGYDYIAHNDYLLLIDLHAFRKIMSHIHWGNNKTNMNRNEQGGLLIGSIFFDDNKKIKYGIVKDIVFSESTSASRGNLEMGHSTWKDMLDEFHNRYSNNDNIRVIGWYHTHPNNLAVFMSGVDQNTQKRFFNQDWHFAIVLNPHKKMWKVFHGRDALPTRGLVVELEKESRYEEYNDIDIQQENRYEYQNHSSFKGKISVKKEIRESENSEKEVIEINKKYFYSLLSFLSCIIALLIYSIILIKDIKTNSLIQPDHEESTLSITQEMETAILHENSPLNDNPIVQYENDKEVNLSKKGSN